MDVEAKKEIMIKGQEVVYEQMKHVANDVVSRVCPRQDGEGDDAYRTRLENTAMVTAKLADKARNEDPSLAAMYDAGVSGLMAEVERLWEKKRSGASAAPSEALADALVEAANASTEY